MKKIALLMDGWKRYFTYAWPAGILQRIKETGEEVNLYIFNSSGNWSKDEEYNEGEYNIFNLPDMEEFDGIIIDLNNILHAKVRENVVSKLKESNVPVISLANEYEDFYYVGIDNQAAIQAVMEHLVDKHQCRKFWFIMGAEDNFENAERMRGIKAFLEKHGLVYDKADVYCENYEFGCGVNGMQYFLEKKEGIPDAIVCANDNIAVGVCAEAEKHGFHAPQDFLVTGFDDFDKASYYLPRITTVSHIREEVGCMCADLFLKIWSGEQVSKFNYTKFEPIFQESCGCNSKRIHIDERRHLKNEILYGIETTEFDEAVLSLEYEFLKCNSFREMIDCIPHCIPAMNCGAMYLVLDNRLNEFRSNNNVYDKRFFEEDRFCTRGYSEHMSVEFAYENGKFVEPKYKEVSGIFPMFDCKEKGTDFLFMPLHFRNKTIGYFVIRKAVYLMEKQYLFQVVNSLTTAMENLHKKEKLNYMNQILSQLYIRDSMTLLYNRSGYEKLANELFLRKKEERSRLLVLYMDLDRLKKLNDEYGHEMGDVAIKAVASALLHCSSVNGIPTRLGGDEFLLIDELVNPSDACTLVEKIRTEIQENGEKMKCPISLTASIGMVITDVESDRALEEYVALADSKMYQEKLKKRAER